MNIRPIGIAALAGLMVLIAHLIRMKLMQSADGRRITA